MPTRLRRLNIQDDGRSAGSHFQPALSDRFHGIEFDHPLACLVGSGFFGLKTQPSPLLQDGPSQTGKGFPLQCAMIGEDFGKRIR